MIAVEPQDRIEDARADLAEAAALLANAGGVNAGERRRVALDLMRCAWERVNTAMRDLESGEVSAGEFWGKG